MREDVTERQFQDAVVELATLTGWLVMHTRPARTAHGFATPIQGHPGYPDLTLAHADRGVLFVELKSQRGRLTPEQVEWQETLAAAGAEVYVVRPSDWEWLVGRLRGDAERIREPADEPPLA